MPVVGLPDTFWLIRRRGDEDASWEVVTDPAVVNRHSLVHFEIELCHRPAALPATTHPVQQDMVAFFRAVGGEIGETPNIRNPQLNADLILEEAKETAESITGVAFVIEQRYDCEPDRPKSLAGAIDGLCDQLATIYGAAVTFGVDLAPFWALVHAANMAKAGGPKREDGKALKPEGWQDPDIAGLLEQLYPTAAAGGSR